MVHCLNNCPKSLKQGRYNWPHDSILSHIVRQLKHDETNLTIAVDLPSSPVPGGSTIPPHILVTKHRPDLVLIDNEKKKIHILELTSCFDRTSNIDGARSRKRTRYASLVRGINSSENEWTATLDTLEICSLGSIRKDTRETLTKWVGRRKAQKLCRKLAKIAIAASYFIFNARSTTEFHQESLIELRPSRSHRTLLPPAPQTNKAHSSPHEHNNAQIENH